MGRTTHNVFWYYHISYMILFPYFTLISVWRIEVFFSGREGPPTSYFGRRENLLDLSTSAVQPYYPEPPRLYSFHMMLEIVQNNRGSLLCILLIENLIPHHEQCAVAILHPTWFEHILPAHNDWLWLWCVQIVNTLQTTIHRTCFVHI